MKSNIPRLFDWKRSALGLVVCGTETIRSGEKQEEGGGEAAGLKCEFNLG